MINFLDKNQTYVGVFPIDLERKIGYLLKRLTDVYGRASYPLQPRDDIYILTLGIQLNIARDITALLITATYRWYLLKWGTQLRRLDVLLFIAAKRLYISKRVSTYMAVLSIHFQRRDNILLSEGHTYACSNHTHLSATKRWYPFTRNRGAYAIRMWQSYPSIWNQERISF